MEIYKNKIDISYIDKIFVRVIDPCYNKISIRVFAHLQKPTRAFQRGGGYAHRLLDNESGTRRL